MLAFEINQPNINLSFELKAGYNLIGSMSIHQIRKQLKYKRTAHSQKNATLLHFFAAAKV